MGILKYLLLLTAGLGHLAAAASPQVTLAWDPSPSPSVAGYRVYYGVSSRNYTNVLDVGPLCSATVSNLVPGTTYYFAATAYDLVGLESDFSLEVSYTVPHPPLRVQFAAEPERKVLLLTGSGPAGQDYAILTTTDLLSWTLLTNVTTGANGLLELRTRARATDAQRFFRLLPADLAPGVPRAASPVQFPRQ